MVAHDNDPIGPFGEVMPVSSLGKLAIGLQVVPVRKNVTADGDCGPRED